MANILVLRIFVNKDNIKHAHTSYHIEIFTSVEADSNQREREMPLTAFCAKALVLSLRTHTCLDDWSPSRRHKVLC